MTPSSDDRLVSAMRSFDPSAVQVSRMRRAVLASYALLQRPLALEWIALFRTRPVVHTALALAAAIVLMVSTPLGSASWQAWKALREAAQAPSMSQGPLFDFWGGMKGGEGPGALEGAARRALLLEDVEEHRARRETFGSAARRLIDGEG